MGLAVGVMDRAEATGEAGCGHPGARNECSQVCLGKGQ